MEILEFISVRLDDDERYANVMLAVGERVKASPVPAMTEFAKGAIDAFLDDPEAVTEVMRWKSQPPNDLKRVLREVAAKRAILAWWLSGENEPESTLSPSLRESYREAQPGYVLIRALAAVWSDHPDYRQEWAS